MPNEQAVAPVFFAGIQVRNTTNGNPPKKQPHDQASLDFMLENGYEIVPQAAKGSVSTSGKRRITKQQASAIADANLAESLGMPSVLAAEPVGFHFEAKVVDFIEQPKKSGKGVYPSTQIEYNGVRFCILYDANHEIGLALKLKLNSSIREDGTFATRSGKTIVGENEPDVA